MSDTPTKMHIVENGAMRICACKQTYRDKQYLDIRNFFTDANGTMRPTQKGIMIPIEKARGLLLAALDLLGPDSIETKQLPVFAFCEEPRKNVFVQKHMVFKSFVKARGLEPPVLEDDPAAFIAQFAVPCIMRCEDYDKTDSGFRLRNCLVVAKWSDAKGKWVKP